MSTTTATASPNWGKLDFIIAQAAGADNNNNNESKEEKENNIIMHWIELKHELSKLIITELI